MYRIIVVLLMKNKSGKIWKESYTSEFYAFSRYLSPATQNTIKYFSQDNR